MTRRERSSLQVDEGRGKVEGLIRRSALEFMADDVHSLCRSTSMLDDLARPVRSGEAGGFVHRRLREYADSTSLPIACAAEGPSDMPGVPVA